MKSRHVVIDKKWKLSIILTTLFLGALAVRWIAILRTPIIAPDAIFYIKAAKLFSAGAYYDALRLCSFSLFPLLISPWYKIFGDWVMAGQWVSTLCGALTVIPLYLLARRIFDEKIALWGTIFYIICPQLVMFSAEILRNIPFVLFYVTALWLGYTGIKDEKMGYLALAGIVIFLSVLIRREGILLLIILSLFLMWRLIKERVSWRKATLLFAFLFISFFGIFFILGAFAPEIMKVTPVLSERVKDEASVSFTNSTIKDIEKEIEEKNLSNHGKNLFQLAKNYRFFIYFFHVIYKSINAFSVPLFLLFLFGFIRRKKVGYRADEFLLVAVYGIFIAAFLLYINTTHYFSARYSFPLVVSSLIWSGVGFEELKERGTRWITARDFPLKDRAIRWVSPLLFLAICIPLLAIAWAPHRNNKLELKEIGLWLKDNGYAHSIIIGQYEFIRLAFYADGEFIELPKGSYQEIMRFAREKEGDLLVLNGKTVNHLSLGFLEKISPRDLQRIDIPGIQTPKYATTVFLIKSEEVGK
jgi:hypothetical protein